MGLTCSTNTPPHKTMLWMDSTRHVWCITLATFNMHPKKQNAKNFPSVR